MPPLHILLLLLYNIVSIYTIPLPGLYGGQINLSNYEVKKYCLLIRPVGAKAVAAAPAPFKFMAGIGAFVKTSKGLSIASSIGSWAGGASNVARNWDRITASGTGEGIFRAANFFMAGQCRWRTCCHRYPYCNTRGYGIGRCIKCGSRFPNYGWHLRQPGMAF